MSAQNGRNPPEHMDLPHIGGIDERDGHPVDDIVDGAVGHETHFIPSVVFIPHLQRFALQFFNDMTGQGFLRPDVHPRLASAFLASRVGRLFLGRRQPCHGLTGGWRWFYRPLEISSIYLSDGRDSCLAVNKPSVFRRLGEVCFSPGAGRCEQC